MQPLIVAAPASGSGKTSVTLGLMGALCRRGLRIAPFKVGPDYIDPGHHAVVCGRPSRNLDGWMCGHRQVAESFDRGCRESDVAVIEGVMGLYDGAAGDTDAGSTAEVARWLQGRVLLVVDARAQARSVAALVQGFTGFAPDLEFAGVILNRVAGPRHADLLREALSSVPGLPPLLGCLPRDAAVALPERHLGLVTADEPELPEVYRRLADWVETHLDLDRLLASLPAGGVTTVKRADAPLVRSAKPVRIGIARDAAFSFYYPENLEMLERAGAELIRFSPLHDPQLPPALDGLYLGGGYPELFAARLSANRDLLAGIKLAAGRGLPIYAECGGLMTLAAQLEDHPMAGVFPAAVRMLGRRQALGYRQIRFSRDTPLGPAGTVVRGHEFHYSAISLSADVPRCYAVADRRQRPLDDEGYRIANVLGSYIHLHFGSNPQVAEHFVRFCEDRRQDETPIAENRLEV